MSAKPFTLVHPAGLRIHPRLTEAEAASAAARRSRNARTQYAWYDLPAAVIGGDEVGLSLCFYRGRLRGISLALVDEKYERSRAESSEAIERCRAEATREWFGRIGFPVRRYSWGEVWAEFDETGFGGGGGVRF
jgi:hypothetical protein